MGTTKKHGYAENQLIMSDLCKALGHPARISIIEMLSENKFSTSMNFQKQLQLSQPTISHHCQILHRYGIIGYEVIGNICFYRLDNRVLDRISDYLDVINVEVPSVTGKVYYPRANP